MRIQYYMYMYTVPMVSVKKYNKNISERLGMVRENVFKKMHEYSSTCIYLGILRHRGALPESEQGSGGVHPT